MRASPIKVILVDDSAQVRKQVTEILDGVEDVDLVATAVDPYVARRKMKEHDPDVMLLDLSLPRMDGGSFLKLLMKNHPMPVIVMSGLAEPRSPFALDALESGAVDVIHKPSGTLNTEGIEEDMVLKIRTAGRQAEHYRKERLSRTRSQKTSASGMVLPRSQPLNPSVMPTREIPVRPVDFHGQYHPRQIILLGASTGGTEALKDVLPLLPKNIPPIAIVQHIPPGSRRVLRQG